MVSDEKKCPQCAEMVKTEAKICRFCGHGFEHAGTSGAIESPATKNSGNTFSKGCLIVLGIVVVLGIIGSLVSPADQTAPTTNTLISGNLASAGAGEHESEAPVGLTGPQANALRSAQQYLAMTGFSRKGLIEQLSSDAGSGFDVADATAAVDSLNVDWNEQAARSAEQYLQMTGFSCSGLIEQLSSSAGSGYTESQARYGAKKAGAC